MLLASFIPDRAKSSTLNRAPPVQSDDRHAADRTKPDRPWRMTMRWRVRPEILGTRVRWVLTRIVSSASGCQSTGATRVGEGK